MSRIIPETQADFDSTRIIERPDGFYWIRQETTEEFGPFDSLLSAVQDMEYVATDADPLMTATLHEVEEEIGINDWIDPDTGEPDEEIHTHIEEH